MADTNQDNQDAHTQDTTMYGSLNNPYGIASPNQVNLHSIAPVFGVNPGLSSSAGAGKIKQPDYLYYDQRGRGIFERTNFNAGTSCLSGMLVGGAYGLVDGWRTSPSKKWKIRLNSVLNKSGRYGSRLGNGLGILAMFYSGIEYGLERTDIEDRLGFGNDLVVPTLAAVSSGVLYKSTSGSPKAILLAGAIGGSLSLFAYGLKSFGIQSSKGFLFF